MEMKRIAVDPETFVRLSCARASAIDAITVLESAKLSAFIEFFPDASLASSPWTGEGLPPVGIEIEAMMRRNMHDDYAWRRAKVVHGCIPGSEGEVLVYDVETTSPAWVDEFRPIRTPEQIVAEERAAGITQMRELVGSLNSHPFAELWDAGYRKQVQP